MLPGKEKTQAIRECRPPRIIHQVRSFCGLVNFFRQSVPNFAQLAAPLHQLTGKDSGWKGGRLPPEAFQAFKELKERLLNPPILAFPDPQRTYHLVVDASAGSEGVPGGLGACLIQFDEDERPRVIGYASKQLQAHEKNYSAFLLELRACVYGIEHFQVYLKGPHFFLYCDHKPLETLGKVHSKTLCRLRQLMLEYNFTIKYKPGAQNGVADFLSRNPVSAIQVPKQSLVQLQDEDPLISKIKKDLQAGSQGNLPRLIKERVAIRHGILWFKKKNGKPAIFVPRSMVPQILKSCHNSRLGGHMGVFKTQERILADYYWPNMAKEVETHVKNCLECQKSKPWSKPAPVPLKPLPQPMAPNHRIHIDLFGPLSTSGSGKKFVLAITDAFTKMVELVAIPSK